MNSLRPTHLSDPLRLSAVLGVLLGAGSIATPVLAQKRIIETAPGEIRHPISVGTNGVAPREVRAPGLIERIYRPVDTDLGVLGGSPPSVSAFSAPSGNSAVLDAVAQQKLLEERERRKNWAIEAYARQNRGEGSYAIPGAENPAEIPAGSNRSVRRADLMLQAVDSDYARSVSEQRGAKVDRPSNPAETAVENAHQRAERMRRGENPNALSDSRDELESGRNGLNGKYTDRGIGPIDPTRLGTPGERDARERQGLSLSGLSVTGEPATLSRESGGTALSDLLPTGGRGESLSPHLETIRQDRDTEFSNLLGETAGSTGNGNRLVKADGGFGLARTDRSAEFRRLLAAEEATPARATTPAANLAGASGNTPGGGLGFDKPGSTFNGAGALPGRELPTFNQGAFSGSLTPAAATPAFNPPTILAPRPAQLPIPIRGQ